MSLKVLRQILPFTCFFFVLSGLAQEGEITFDYDKISLKEAFKDLRRRYQAPVMYSPNLLEGISVSASCQDCTPEKALETLLENAPLGFVQKGSQFILKRARIKPCSISGQVVLQASGAGVSHTMITLEQGNRVIDTTYCDINGNFKFKELKPGRYALSLSSDIFSNKTIPDIRISREVPKQKVLMTVDALSMAPEQMVVRDDPGPVFAKQRPRRMRRPAYSGFMGTPGSAFSSLSRFPGVAAHDWSSGELNVQGSAPADTAVYVDGALIESPAHFAASGFTSQGLIDVDAVEEMELFSDGMPIEYGDRMGGVLTMTTTAPRKKLEASLSTSTAETKAKTAGTFSDGKGSWFFNMRKGYSSLIDRFRKSPVRHAANKHAGNEDMMGKVQYFFSDIHMFSLHLLQGSSDFDLNDNLSTANVLSSSETRSHEDNRTTWANLKSFWTDDIWSETVVSWTDYNSDFSSQYQIPGLYQRSLSNNRNYQRESIRQDWVWEHSNRHQFKWGFLTRKSSATFDFDDSVAFLNRQTLPTSNVLSKRTDTEDADGSEGGDHDRGGDGISTRTTESRPEEGYYKMAADAGVKSREYGFYLGDRIQLTERLVTELALRYDEQSHTEEHQWSPRINFTFNHDSNTVLRAKWGRFYQSHALHQLDLHHRETSYSPAELSEHAMISFEHQFNSVVGLNAEVYRKQYSSLRDRPLEVSTRFLNEESFEDGSIVRVRPTSGRANGLMFGLNGRHKEQNIDWMFNYTLSRAEDEVNGVLVPRSWDQRHAVNAVLNYRYNEAFTLSASWKWHSGWPTTEVWLESQTDEQGNVQLSLAHGQLNNSTLPEYQRLDLRLDQRIELSGDRQFFWYLEVINFLDHSNTTGYDYSVGRNAGGDYYLSSRPRDRDSLLPMLGLRWEF